MNDVYFNSFDYKRYCVNTKIWLINMVNNGISFVIDTSR